MDCEDGTGCRMTSDGKTVSIAEKMVYYKYRGTIKTGKLEMKSH